MRERAFAVLGDRVIGSRFLDLFAGTGAVGLEALSRGAIAAVFVERHRMAATLIESNLAAFDLTDDRAELIAKPATAAVSILSLRGDRFDVAWADPPFDAWGDGLDVMVALFEAEVLGAGSLACLECPTKADVEGSLPTNLEIVRDLAGSASRVVMIERDAG
jgi:16S rRNA (guanine(966)-N(2))-methyltransferase RsmD